ncbi:hypothetical protein F66182_8898 [Fusarium sp. NRRL 66182]|nr:hypothetical protein F66182_8898 [Fusarium sp. NRRL 66182]
MSDPCPPPARWAVLIGVGFTYSRNNHDSQGLVQDRSLQGAVNDINAISEYLGSRTVHVNLITLTATKSRENEKKHVEGPDQLATVDNVTSVFIKILRDSRPNDCVYIHYSGHGSRRSVDGAVALELVNPVTLETQYMYGTMLRNAIKKMIEKELTVLLVLDCCFSGSVLRDDRPQIGNIRYMEHNTYYDTSSDWPSPFDYYGTGALRDGAVTLSRFLDPEGYAIISACGPHELASELAFDSGATRGALSYLLINSLNLLSRRGDKISNDMLHQHLRAQFHARFPEQTPMLYGHRGLSFFGDFSGAGGLVSFSITSMHRSMEDGRLVLHAGQAHGVHKDDEYALTSFETPLNSKFQNSIKSRVCAVDCLTSRLETTTVEDKDLIKKGSTWEATLLTSFSPHKVRICMNVGATASKDLQKAASATNYLELCPFSTIDSVTEPVSYLVERMEHGFKVRDLAASVTNTVAKVACSSHENTDSLVGILHHIARYKFFEGIENNLSDPRLEKSFSLNTIEVPGADGYLCVKNEETLVLTFTNIADRPLYLGIFLFTQFWEIRNLLSEKGEDAYLVVPPKASNETGIIELPLKMTVPDTVCGNGLKQVEDMVKIFITSRPFVFPGIILPKLQQGLEHRGGPDSLDLVLQRLNGSHQSVRGDEKCQWTTRSYLIRTWS